MTDLVTSPVFLANKLAYENEQYKIIVNQGGTRSGKTYSIMQLLILLATLSDNEISIVSKTLPHIKRGVLRDFKKIMLDQLIFNEKDFNKSELIYQFSDKTFIEFFSADDSAKLRGPGRDILFVNELNLLNKDEWQQLLFRTRGKVFVDYNPVDEFHWIYDDILPRPDCKFIQSSYLDNYDFLPHGQIAEIERLKNEDNNYWKIFGLGERATSTNLIFPSFSVDSFRHEGETIYGLDFGFNHPTALVKVSFSNYTVFIEQMIYESGLITSELIKGMDKVLSNKYDYIYADSSRPESIKEIHDAGYNIHSADKGPHSVKASIDYMKRFRIVLHSNSPDLQKEFRTYKWKESRNGEILDEPVKFNDDLVDASRMAVFSHRQNIEVISSFPNVHFDSINKTRHNKYSEY